MSAVPAIDERPVYLPPVPQFHTLRVAGIERVTPEAIAVRFAVPPELREAYRFKAGQFVTLKGRFPGVVVSNALGTDARSGMTGEAGASGAAPGNSEPEELRRSYSLCCGVADYAKSGELVVGIKAIPGGRFSSWANQHLKPGDRVEVMTPDGRFHCALHEDHAKHYVAFAGGSGITPVLALIRTTLATEPRSRFTLIYGNRNLASIMFAEPLEELKNRYLGRLALYHVISDEPQEVALFNGVLDADKCAQFLEALVPAASIDEAFICGPGQMMDAAEAALKAAGVARERIHVERFGTPLQPQAGKPEQAGKPPPGAAGASGKDGTASAPAAQVDIIAGGKTRRIAVPYEGAGLLDTALAAGLDLPYACKTGVCCTCRARVLEGEVRMDRNYTLEEREMAQGFVLTCQSHPLTERVVVSYDER